MEPKCKNCYYFLEVAGPNSTKYYNCLNDYYPYAIPADIKEDRFWDKNICFKEMEDRDNTDV